MREKGRENGNEGRQEGKAQKHTHRVLIKNERESRRLYYLPAHGMIKYQKHKDRSVQEKVG